MRNDIKNLVLFPLNIMYSISPRIALQVLFRLKTGYRLNLKSPSTYSEKIQWIKLNYKNPLLPKLVDKYTVRGFVSQKAPELLIRLLWEGYEPESIPWDELPNRFVIKVTHGSGYNIICKNKTKLDRAKCCAKIRRWLKTKYLKCYGEWFYGVENPRIIIEEFLDTGNECEPEDYKIYCFNGNPKYISVYTNRFSGIKESIYDLEWNHLEGVSLGDPCGDPLPKPAKLEELIKYAQVLSKDFPHVRVDLYVVNDNILEK